MNDSYINNNNKSNQNISYNQIDNDRQKVNLNILNKNDDRKDNIKRSIVDEFINI